MGLSKTYLESKDSGLNELERLAVDLDEALASLRENVSGFPSLLFRTSLLTLAIATAVAVFFLPKQATDWVLEDMIMDCVVARRA